MWHSIGEVQSLQVSVRAVTMRAERVSYLSWLHPFCSLHASLGAGGSKANASMPRRAGYATHRFLASTYQAQRSGRLAGRLKKMRGKASNNCLFASNNRPQLVV